MAQPEEVGAQEMAQPEEAAADDSAAIKQVVNELPELKGGTQGTGTQGAFARQSNVPMSAFERGLLG